MSHPPPCLYIFIWWQSSFNFSWINTDDSTGGKGSIASQSWISPTCLMNNHLNVCLEQQGDWLSADALIQVCTVVFFFTARLQVQVRLRGAVSRRSAGGHQREEQEDLPHRQGNASCLRLFSRCRTCKCKPRPAHSLQSADSPAERSV